MSAKISDSITKLTSIVGSPYYMAPEIFTAEEYDFRADIWSVGITAIEMATVSPHSLTQGPTKLFELSSICNYKVYNTVN